MMRHRASLHWHAGAWLAGLIIGALACAIVALAMTEARSSSASRADGAPAGRTIGSDARSGLRHIAGVIICNSYGEIARQLAEGFAEVPVARGQIGPQTLLVVFVSPAETFSIVRVDANGAACLLTDGEGWGVIALQSNMGEL